MIYKDLFNITYLKTKVSTIAQGLLVLVIIVFLLNHFPFLQVQKLFFPLKFYHLHILKFKTLLISRLYTLKVILPLNKSSIKSTLALLYLPMILSYSSLSIAFCLI